MSDEARLLVIENSRATARELLSSTRSRAEILHDIQAQLTKLRDASAESMFRRVFDEKLAHFTQRLFVSDDSSSSPPPTSTTSTSTLPPLNSSSTAADVSDSSSVVDLVCYGIGSIALSSKARTQLAVLLLLRSVLNAPSVLLYDPVLADDECTLLQSEFRIDVLRENDEARRAATRATFFFMPHCPRALYHNVLCANANALSRIAILGNSFSRYSLLGSSSKVNYLLFCAHVFVVFFRTP